MKTIGDIAALLKRNEGSRLYVTIDSRGTFTVEFLGYRQTSKRLDDALEHVVEEMRRNASGVGAMRDGKGTFTETITAPAQIHPAYLLKNFIAGSAAPSQVTAACGTVTAAGGTCPQCNGLPETWISGQSKTLQCCACKNIWTVYPKTGDVFLFQALSIHTTKFVFDGNDWHLAP